MTYAIESHIYWVVQQENCITKENNKLEIQVVAYKSIPDAVLNDKSKSIAIQQIVVDAIGQGFNPNAYKQAVEAAIGGVVVNL